MAILIVDDSPPVVALLAATVQRAGYGQVVTADCGAAALGYLGIEPPGAAVAGLECILLDIVMPGLDGVEVCRRIKAHASYIDTPVIMVTMLDQAETMRDAFEAGAHDYIAKPVRELELLARLKAAIALRREIAARRQREEDLLRLSAQLAEANERLTQLTVTDDLTKVGNRRYFSACLESEWRRSYRDAAPLSLIFVALDRFQEVAEHLGTARAEDCLKLVAQVLQICLRRTTDHLCRYGDSQFAILLPKTPLAGARVVAGLVAQSIAELHLLHHDGQLTVSQGLAAVVPSGAMAIGNLIFLAEQALESARQEGGKQIHCANDVL